MSTLDQARIFVQSRVDYWLTTDPNPPWGPEAEALWWRLGFEDVETENGTFIVCYESGLATLFELSRVDKDVRKLFAHKVASKINASMPLAKTEREFAALYLNGSLPEIAERRGRKPSANFGRNLFLYDVVRWTSEVYGLKPTRNDVSKDRASACDTVAGAFAKRGRHDITYRTVKDVWTDKKFRAYLEDIRSVIERHEAEQLQNPHQGSAALAQNPTNPDAPLKV